MYHYSKCQYEGCCNFGEEELSTFEEFSDFNGFYCLNHIDEVTQEIEELIDEMNSCYDNDYYDDDDDRFIGWDFGASADI